MGSDMLALRGVLFLRVFSQEDSAPEHVTAQVASADSARSSFTARDLAH